jgi:hypothetical protein
MKRRSDREFWCVVFFNHILKISYTSRKVWLFKPKIRVSYMLPTPYLLPKQGSIDASKVLYKILGPSSSTMALKECVIFDEYQFVPLTSCT